MIMIMIMYHWEEAVAKWLTNDRPSKWGRLSFTSMYVSLVSWEEVPAKLARYSRTFQLTRWSGVSGR